MAFSLKKSRSEKIIDELKESNEQLLKVIEELEAKPYLVSVDRVNRVNSFIFVKSGNITVIETMGLISDDINKWKEELGLR